jgi:hypothetical protein
MLSTVSERLPRAKFTVLKYLRMGVITLDHISDMDMVALARLWLRVERLRDEIDLLRSASWARQRRNHEAWLAALE